MTLEITKTNGELSADSRDKFTAFFRSLPDGGHIIAAYPASGAMGQIERLAAWFNSVTETERENPAFLDQLIVRSNEFAYYLLRFAAELGDLYADKNATELRRKAAYFSTLHTLRKEAEEAKQKFVVSIAEIEAEDEISELRAAESLADALYQSAKVLYDSAQGIQARMSQQISNLKAQRDAFLRADNSNFPNS